ncbi:lachesin isoform X2 [Cephus cinctus]|uniref:Lachesin isoform X2 n=1 Tax=Cephus cinctus TaxID=211228 RepID=A0AAJ7CFR4_CEPCN|nr:lachesin isoform X2 [Cephus cinctus]
MRVNNQLPIPARMATVIAVIWVLLHGGRLTSAGAFTTVTTRPDPEFIDQIGNITVPAGRNVKLACSVNNLGPYRVAWMLFDKSAILTVHNHVITRNPRITVSHDKHRTWFLHINDVQEEDMGKYMCQINTATAKTQYGYLHVVVPPDIDDSQSSSDAIVREGANLSLTCKAKGSPTPSIRWKRDDGSKISINKSLSVIEFEGDTLEMSRISRLDMGSYLCIASNGIPPTVSKQIKVSVDFPPMLWIPHQLVGAPLGFSVTLECHTEAHPTSLNYWTRENGTMIAESRKHKAITTKEKPSYKTHMKLTINDIQEQDYGSYKCVAKNPRGETEGTIRLYKSAPPSTSPSPPTTDLSRKGNKFQSNLNEIDKSEQKSGDLDRKRKYNWPPENDMAASITTTMALLVMGLIAVTAIR